MASIKREETSRGPRWRVRYRRPDGTETSQRFDRYQTAKEFAVKIENDRRVGTYVDRAGPRTLLADLVEDWKAIARHGPGTIATRDSDLRNWILPELGRYRIGQVGPIELEKFLRHLEAGLQPVTVVRIWGWVTAIFATAVRARMLAVNPTEGLAPPAPPRPLLALLEHGQVEAVIGELPAWYRVPALLAAHAGLRHGEVFGLTVDRVSLRTLRDRVLPVDRQLLILPGQRFLKLPKGEKVRQVPIPDQLGEALSAHMAAFPARAVIFDRVEQVEAQLVFTTGRGTLVRRNTFDDCWTRAASRAGLPKGARFHDLRHYYASTLIDAGLREREIGARLGHSSTEVTARYGDLLEGADERTRTAVEAAMAARAASVKRSVRPAPAGRE